MQDISNIYFPTPIPACTNQVLFSQLLHKIHVMLMLFCLNGMILLGEVSFNPRIKMEMMLQNIGIGNLEIYLVWHCLNEDGYMVWTDLIEVPKN